VLKRLVNWRVPLLNINIDYFKNLTDFDNILVVDEHGVIIFYDVVDLNVLIQMGLRPEEFMGNHITAFYKNLTNETSTIMKVLKDGVAVSNVKQELVTKNGNILITVNSTYPILENEKIIGAIEFSKHFYTKENIQSLDKLAHHKVYRRNNTYYTIDDIVSVNPMMENIKNKMKRIAISNSTVLIYGETGTGKEMIAQAIHNLSDRYGSPFISVNCGAIPPNLMESTLFGTVKGSFTGAADMPGLFEQAEGGTLFLDEVNSLDIFLQVKLLKAIEEKTIRRIGGNKNITLNIRVISATNEDPDLLVSEKRLRADLYYRLGVVQLDLPPLKERKEDIEILLSSFINFYNKNMNIVIEDVQDEVRECFNGYSWPGNVRELKNAVETAFNNTTSNTITIDDIPKRIRDFNKILSEKRNEQSNQSLKDAVEQYEKDLISHELNYVNGKLTEAAKKLGISKQLLKYKMDKYQLS
jgi:arginine utilization regulatory protein